MRCVLASLRDDGRRRRACIHTNRGGGSRLSVSVAVCAQRERTSGASVVSFNAVVHRPPGLAFAAEPASQRATFDRQIIAPVAADLGRRRSALARGGHDQHQRQRQAR